MAQPTRDAVWLVRNMEGTWNCEELNLDDITAEEKQTKDITRRNKEVIHVDSTSSNGTKIPT